MPAAKRVVAAPAAVIHPKDVQKIKNLNGLIEFLGAELEWPLEVEADVVEQSFEIVPSRFVSPEQAKKLREGRVLQLRPFVSSQPWGIFVVEFAQPDVSITTLRQVLREQLEYRGKDSSLPSWAQEDLLFLCVTHDPKTNSYKQFTFAHFRRQKTESGERPAVLSTFGWEKGDTHLRTLCDYNLRALKYPTDLGDAQAWRTQWREAFDVEKVTQKFFEEYGKVFKSVEESIRGVAKGEERLYAQRLFNRLMFLYFLERKGWLKFEDKANYLRALWDKAEKNDENFLNDRLYWAFFSGLGNTLDDARGHDLQVLEGLRGHVPFLNGGLFDLVDPYDPRDRKGRPLVEIPNSEFGKILDLFESFNFTVEESTPQDVAVAVDPEMLGKVFEELVTGRHETGSYYTPRPVVAFMCREALKSFLAPVGEDAAALARFVDENDASELRNSEQVLEALKRVKVCDPACGSGAYLLGMMQELLRLREGLFVKGKKADPLTSYEKKLSIISHNLYGVDVDRFAVNIAMLRLWLSLVVDLDDNTPLDDIPALPNLNYKIACGDSLSAPDPQARDLTSEAYEEDAAILAELHDENLRQGIERKKGNETRPKKQIEEDIAKMEEQIAALFGDAVPEGVHNWRSAFAQVFAPRHEGGPRSKARPGGFDIVLANPPYVRADAQFKHIKDETARQAAISQWKEYRAALLKSKYFETIFEKWDLYVPFLERSHQMLRVGGQMVFIIPDAYNAAKYTSKSHEFFLANSRIERLDFCSEIPLFNAGVANTILHFSKGTPEAGHQPTRVRRWGEKAEDFTDNHEVLSTGSQLEAGAKLFKSLAIEADVEHDESFVPLEKLLYISKGMVLHSEDPEDKVHFTKDDLIVTSRDKQHPKPFMEGKYMMRWIVRKQMFLEYGTKRAPALCSRKLFPEFFEVPEKLIAMDISGDTVRVCYDNQKLFHNHSAWSFVPWHLLKGVVNRSISKTCKYKRQAADGDREEREKLSKQFHLKYLLAVMNSSFARKWLEGKRRSKLHIYPDDWKLLPMAPIALDEQKPFVELVDAILNEFKAHGYPLPAEAAARVAEREDEINERVAKLYGL